jgi:DNA-directed RNA polymerase subunit H (RpoH/RPB5)
MVVKSSTKKRLIELGVPEDHAHRLADDANMDAIKRMSVEEVAEKLSLKIGEDVLESIMAIVREQAASRRRRSRTPRMTISARSQDFDDAPKGEDRFNVLNHELVPHHELVPIDDEVSVLAPWSLEMPAPGGGTRLAKELLPKITISDAAIQAIKEIEESENEELPAGWLTNRVVRVIRYSESAGVTTAYRVVVEGE